MTHQNLLGAMRTLALVGVQLTSEQLSAVLRAAEKLDRAERRAAAALLRAAEKLDRAERRAAAAPSAASGCACVDALGKGSRA